MNPKTILKPGTKRSHSDSVFSTETTLSLISKVQAVPALWKKSEPDYKNINRQQIHWQAVADELQIPAPAVREKWRNLRAQFRKNRLLVRGTSSSGSSSKEVYQPKWYAYDAMLFLNETLEPGETIDSLRINEGASSTQPRDQDDIVFPSQQQISSPIADAGNSPNIPTSPEAVARSPTPTIATNDEPGPSTSQDSSIRGVAATRKKVDASILKTLGYLEASYKKMEERQHLNAFVDLMTERLLRRKKEQLEEIQNAILRLIDSYEVADDQA